MERLHKYSLFVLLVFSLTNVVGQVDQIKNSSSSNSKGSGSSRSGEGGSSSGSSSGFFVYLFVDLIGRGVGEWQRSKLLKKEINPRIVSLELPMQVAVQPSNYYLFNPRVRGNWGLFSTDFRVNYLLEQDMDGYKDLTTFDWQIIQLNLITAKNVIGRVGFGMMNENFGDKQSFFESTYGLSILSSDHQLGGSLEYRVAKDYETDVTPRREISATFEKQLFTTGAFHGFVTLGGVYQRYYNSVSVWGIQGGIIFRIHRPVPLRQENNLN
jgi:hypothetical protein